jgi:hypothetical protein
MVLNKNEFPEFAKNKRLLWIAQEWARYAPELAEWTMEHLVNRRDVWSQYIIKNGEVSVVMLPIKERRKIGAEMITMRKLVRHYTGRAIPHLIGLHSISDHSTCKWFAVDIDLHNEEIANADEVVHANTAAVFEWAQRLRDQGFDPLVMDSNGVGGFHIWVVFDKEYPLSDTYDFADQLRSDWEELGLPRKPEIFPPKREVKPDDLPYGLRLPGRHHYRQHYTRIYNFDADGENEWLEGGEAIEAILATRPAKLKLTKRRAKKAKVETKKTKTTTKPAQKKTATRKPRVCVDLDGVLAEYNGWDGFDSIGAPIPGALEFARSLSKIADLVIFTSRCSHDIGTESDRPVLTPAQMRIRVIDWLEANEFPFSDVYIGQGKPRVAAFIDDRAVPCKPQDEGDAFENSLQAVRRILRRKSRLPPQ